MTIQIKEKRSRLVFFLLFSLLLCGAARAQTATSLKSAQSVFIGSLGTREGAEDLRRELEASLQHNHRFKLAPAPEQADLVLEGRGELWIRGYDSLSPRARSNTAAVEPIYAGFLSLKARGLGGEVLWSYFAPPKRISFHDLKHDLVDQVVTNLLSEIDKGAATIQSAAAPAGTAETLRGAGATFPFPIYQDWFAAFHLKYPDWRLDYSPIGSEAGLEQLASNTVDFAGSDILPGSQSTPGPDDNVRHFPSVGGAIVLTYNLPKFNGELRLTGKTIADIFSGEITRWNDPRLRELNHKVSLPNAAITIVHRADGSGTTYAFTDYLSQASETWKKKPGTGARVTWPAGIEAEGNAGVARSVAATPYSIGYVEFIYAFENRLPSAFVQNAQGRFMQADLPSIAAAAEAVSDAGPATLSIANSASADAYPISTFSWILFRNQLPPGKRTAMLRFIEWMLTSGQRECSALGYAPLPKKMVIRELAAARSLE